MMKKLSVCSAACLLTFSMSTFANVWETVPSSSGSNVPDSTFFAGLGGGYNSFDLNQNIDASAVSYVYNADNTPAASGAAGGPATPFNDIQSTFAPAMQLGYFKHFTNSSFLWGFKFSYQYLGLTSTNQKVNIFQAGSFTKENGETDNFTGHVAIASTQTIVNHELTLMPIIGQSFKNAYVYFGAGPVLFGIQSNINNGTGYSDINGSHSDLTGAGDTFSNDIWVLGGGAQVGISYYFDPTWSVDVNYTLAMTDYTINTTAPFTSSFIAGGNTYHNTGTMQISNEQRVIVQGAMLTINKAF